MGRADFVKILVKVTPNSRFEEVSRDGDRYLVKVKEPPREGKANRAVIKLLAEHFNVPQSFVRVVSGSGSRNKVIEIMGK